MARLARTVKKSRARPEKGGGRRWIGRLLSGSVGVAALVAAAGVMVHAYSEGRSSAGGRDTVLIKAEPGPFKVKPESPGGRAIPDRDKQIYDRIQAAPEGEPVERLLPAPEAPLPPEKVLEAHTAAPPEPAIPDSLEPPAKTEASPKPEVKTAKRTTPAAAKKAERKYRLQLAALRSRAAADEAWKRLENRHRKLLAGREVAIVEKDLGPPKGVYYRILLGPATDRETARRLCAKLAKRNVGCLVVRR